MKTVYKADTNHQHTHHLSLLMFWQEWDKVTCTSDKWKYERRICGLWKILSDNLSEKWIAGMSEIRGLAGTKSRHIVGWCHITYLLTPCSRVLLEKLTGFQLVKKFPAFYGTQRFNTTVTTACHLSLSWASLFQSYFLKIHLNIILPSMPGSP